MEIHFSKYDFTIKTEGEKQLIFDVVRKKFVALTPEEWVRQHIVHFLIYDHQFPVSLISLEKKLVLNELTKRTDIVLYNTAGQPVLIVECKAPDVVISQKTFDQVARYNLVLRVPFLWVTNGSVNALCRIHLSTSTWNFESGLPSADLLKSTDTQLF